MLEATDMERSFHAPGRAVSCGGLSGLEQRMSPDEHTSVYCGSEILLYVNYSVGSPPSQFAPHGWPLESAPIVRMSAADTATHHPQVTWRIRKTGAAAPNGYAGQFRRKCDPDPQSKGRAHTASSGRPVPLGCRPVFMCPLRSTYTNRHTKTAPTQPIRYRSQNPAKLFRNPSFRHRICRKKYIIKTYPHSFIQLFVNIP